MKVFIVIAISTIISLSVPCNYLFAAEETSWRIGPRTLPIPAAIDSSPELRKSLSQTPTPDVEGMQSIKLTTHDEWSAYVAERDKGAKKTAIALAQLLKVEIEEDTIAGVKVHRVTPAEIDKKHQQHLFLYIHGGAWVFNGGMAGTAEAVTIAARLQIPVISIDYRMPPAHPAPAATDDVASVWKALIDDTPPALIAMGGTSAGANITLSSIHRFKDLGLPVPGALYLGTPAVDVSKSGDSRSLNEGVDRVLVSWLGLPDEAGALYAGELGVDHPYVSPIFGDFSGFPPAYVISGTRDLMLSDAVRAHRALRREGNEAELHIYEGHSHGDYMFMMDSPESVEHYAELNRFVLKHLSNPLPAKGSLPPDLKDIELPKSVVY